jgi:hypothetical protein
VELVQQEQLMALLYLEYIFISVAVLNVLAVNSQLTDIVQHVIRPVIVMAGQLQ